MKNPFEKSNNSSLIAAVVLGSAAAGALAYLFLTDKGADIRSEGRKKLKAFAKNKAAKAISKKTRVPKKLVKAVI